MTEKPFSPCRRMTSCSGTSFPMPVSIRVDAHESSCCIGRRRPRHGAGFDARIASGPPPKQVLHSTPDFRQKSRVFATTSHSESSLARPSGRCGYFLRKPSNRWTAYTPAGWCTRFASKQGYNDFEAYSHARITI